QVGVILNARENTEANLGSRRAVGQGLVKGRTAVGIGGAAQCVGVERVQETVVGAAAAILEVFGRTDEARCQLFVRASSCQEGHRRIETAWVRGPVQVLLVQRPGHIGT